MGRQSGNRQRISQTVYRLVMQTNNSLLLVILGAVLLSAAGCTSGSLYSARQDFYRGDPQAALSTLAEQKSTSRRDSLLFLMERGLILHELGDYQHSAQIFREAAQLMEQQETISLSQQSAALVTSDWVTEYKGEYSERLWVHTYSMMNYLLLNRFESALVEAKQALKVLERYPDPLSGDHFTRALIAHCFEALQEYNGAYIEYRKLAEQLANPVMTAEKLYSLASRLGFNDDAAKYQAILSAGSTQPLRARHDSAGELVLFIGMGGIPVKTASNIVVPPSIRISFPQYTSRTRSAFSVAVYDDSSPLTGFAVSTDLGHTARQSLSLRAKAYVARMAARTAIKESLSQIAENENAVLGIFLRAAFFMAEEADTRGWETLPETLTLMIISLPPGHHNIRLSFRSRHNTEITEIMLPDTYVTPYRRTYRSVRITD